MSWTTGILNEIALSLWDNGLTTLSPLLILQLVVQTTGTTFVTSWYTHGLASSYLEGANFLTANLCQRLLMLWVILNFYFGGPGSRRFRQVGPTWGDSGILWRSTDPSLFIGFGHSFLSCVELARLIGIRPYNAIAFSGYCCICLCISHLPSRTILLVLCAEFRCRGDIPLPLLFLQGFHNWTLPESLPYDGSCRYPGWSTCLQFMVLQ